MVVNLLDPEVIVLGGGLSRIGALYERLPELTARWVFSRKLNTPIRANLHGDASGMRGAAFLWEVEDRDRNSNPGATAPSSGQANP
jgi:fructokinase